MATLNSAVLFGLGSCTFAPADLGFDLLLQAFHLLPPAERFDPLHDFGMVGEFGRQFCLFGLPVEPVLAESLVHLRIIAAEGTRKRMFDVETRIGPDEVRNANLPAGVGADVLLLLPQAVFQHLVVRWFHFAAGFGGVLTADLFGEFPIFSLPLTLVLLDGLAAVGIIEPAGRFGLRAAACLSGRATGTAPAWPSGCGWPMSAGIRAA